jgi:hypothetical protein
MLTINRLPASPVVARGSKSVGDRVITWKAPMSDIAAQKKLDFPLSVS